MNPNIYFLPFFVVGLTYGRIAQPPKSLNNAPGNIFADCVDPECNQDVYQIIRTKGYPCEQHVVTTLDKYELTIFRIPHGKNAPAADPSKPKPVVFLQHGLLASAADWILNFPEQSLGYILADAGYDVWLGNVRGNTYGRKNVDLDPVKNANQFWDFTFDEMAKYDLPAMVEFVLKMTGQSQLNYVGHSQGTSMGFIQFSENPEWASAKIKGFYALAPIVYLKHTKSALRYLAPFSEFGWMRSLLGENEFLPNNGISKWLCHFVDGDLCSDILYIVAGYDTNNMNQTRLPVYASKSPAGTSTNNIIHFGQLIESGNFQAYDYGSAGNKKHYGTDTPYIYRINTMTVPTALFWGDTDIFADPTDVASEQELITNLIGSYRYYDEDHLDFVWGLNAPREVYPQLLSDLNARNEM